MALFTVTNLFDSGPGSLRQAILDANATDGIADTIDFDVTGTIGLTSGQLSVTDFLTIDGPGAHLLTVDAQGNSFRVFNIDDGTDGATIDVFIEGLTITGGRAAVDGGGIRNTENLTLTDSAVSGNESNFFGGGIYNGNGTATITNSTISGNQARFQGGGIYNYSGTLNLTNSTVSGNESRLGSGGGVFNGGIFYSGTATITNSTISGNRARDGGGIYNVGTANLTNTLIANSPSGGDCFNVGTIATSINNLTEDGTCQIPGQIGFKMGDPQLGPLQDNGGPTQTHALLPGSIAIDGGWNPGAVGPGGVPLTLDQRGTGFPRIVNGTVDVGAVEAVPEPLTLVGSAAAVLVGAALRREWRKLKHQGKDRTRE